MPDLSSLRSSLEPAALQPTYPAGETDAWESEIEASLAISAKRQADALERIARLLENVATGDQSLKVTQA